MNVAYQVAADLYDLNGIREGAEEFLDRYAAHRTGPTTTYHFEDDASVQEATGYLDDKNIGYQVFYAITLSLKEAADHPAFYLGFKDAIDLITNDRVNRRKMGKNQMLLNYGTDTVVVTPRARTVLDSVTKGLRWESLAGSRDGDYARMIVDEQLPDPIIVPNPTDIGANVKRRGTYAVASDGRDVITEANVRKVADVGIAVSDHVVAGRRTLRWRPRLIASGHVIAALRKADLKGHSGFLAPLILESDPLARLTTTNPARGTASGSTLTNEDDEDE